MSEISINGVDWLYGEVIFNYTTLLETGEITDPYVRDNSDPNQLFAIDVLVDADNTTTRITNVKPANNNIKQIPIIGENVLLFRADNHESNEIKSRLQWYYLPPIGIQSNINNNILGSISGENFIKDKLIPDVSVPPLQPYRGDILIEGRWGNSIRFGSTIEFNNTLYTTEPTWTGKTIGDPIITLSNGRKRQVSRPFLIEESDSDNSSLYLTSTQKLSRFTLNTPLSNYTSESSFETSQFIGIADRVILKAKTDIVVLDSQKSVVINTPELKLGDDKADESMVHGDELATILKELIATIRKPRFGGGLAAVFSPAELGKFNELINRVENIKSSKFKLKK
mgnify:CR=1 FL=1